MKRQQKSKQPGRNHIATQITVGGWTKNDPGKKKRANLSLTVDASEIWLFWLISCVEYPWISHLNIPLFIRWISFHIELERE